MTRTTYDQNRGSEKRKETWRDRVRQMRELEVGKAGEVELQRYRERYSNIIQYEK